MQETMAIKIIIITRKGPAAPHGTTFRSLLKWALWRYRSVNCPHCLQKCELSPLFTEVWIVLNVYWSVNCPYCLHKCELSLLFTEVWIVPTVYWCELSLLFTEVWTVPTVYTSVNCPSVYWSVNCYHCLLKFELSLLFTEMWIVTTVYWSVNCPHTIWWNTKWIDTWVFFDNLINNWIIWTHCFFYELDQ